MRQEARPEAAPTGSESWEGLGCSGSLGGLRKGSLPNSPHFLLPGLFESDCRGVFWVPLEGCGGMSQLLRKASPSREKHVTLLLGGLAPGLPAHRDAAGRKELKLGKHEDNRGPDSFYQGSVPTSAPPSPQHLWPADPTVISAALIHASYSLETPRETGQREPPGTRWPGLAVPDVSSCDEDWLLALLAGDAVHGELRDIVAAVGMHLRELWRAGMSSQGHVARSLLLPNPTLKASVGHDIIQSTGTLPPPEQCLMPSCRSRTVTVLEQNQRFCAFQVAFCLPCQSLLHCEIHVTSLLSTGFPCILFKHRSLRQCPFPPPVFPVSLLCPRLPLWHTLFGTAVCSTVTKRGSCKLLYLLSAPSPAVP